MTSKIPTEIIPLACEMDVDNLVETSFCFKDFAAFLLCSLVSRPASYTELYIEFSLVNNEMRLEGTITFIMLLWILLTYTV
jgi:hypothetical protein